MTATLLRPVNAARDVWAHPDRWQPGDPLYRRSTAERWQREGSLIDIKLDVPHPEDCTGTDCPWVDESFRWEAHPEESRVEWIHSLYGAGPDGPGTEFYGAVIGPRYWSVRRCCQYGEIV